MKYVLAGVLLTTAVCVEPASATPGSGFAPSPIVNGHFGTLDVKTENDKTGHWGMILKTKDETDIGADRLTVQAGGSSGWHSHPSAVYVTVLQGTIVWTDGSDPLCRAHTYSAGQSFIEGAYRIHNVESAGGAEFVAVVIKPAGFEGPKFRLDEGKPNNCNF